MIICVCKAVSERHIRSAVKGGAASLRDLTHGLGVGTCCGKCLPEARATLCAALEQRGESVLGRIAANVATHAAARDGFSGSGAEAAA
jgi:bacterioferritin-associated ferredoxin